MNKKRRIIKIIVYIYIFFALYNLYGMYSTNDFISYLNDIGQGNVVIEENNFLYAYYNANLSDHGYKSTIKRKMVIIFGNTCYMWVKDRTININKNKEQKDDVIIEKLKLKRTHNKWVLKSRYHLPAY